MPGSGPPPSSSALPVLLAEDNRVAQRVAVSMLQSLGYTCRICATGREAVDAFRGGHFACVLMDGMMPEMDGFEAAREIRRLEHAQGTPRTPIIALTASARPEDRSYCLSSGMDDFLSKPVRLETLAATLARWIAPPAAG